jgi:hypothetical protein
VKESVERETERERERKSSQAQFMRDYYPSLFRRFILHWKQGVTFILRPWELWKKCRDLIAWN